MPSKAVCAWKTALGAGRLHYKLADARSSALENTARRVWAVDLSPGRGGASLKLYVVASAPSFGRSLIRMHSQHAHELIDGPVPLGQRSGRQDLLESWVPQFPSRRSTCCACRQEQHVNEPSSPAFRSTASMPRSMHECCSPAPYSLEVACLPRLLLCHTAASPHILCAGWQPSLRRLGPYGSWKSVAGPMGGATGAFYLHNKVSGCL